MTCQEKVRELRENIIRQLTARITADYWLMEVPHYDNVGDSLIWQGELDFLRSVPHRCKGIRAWDSTHRARIGKGDLVLFQGGGNFGDLWTLPHDFKMRVMSEHPQNRFLFFPQTVYFKDEQNLKRCAEFMAGFDVTICARDATSYETLRAHFKNEILLVPDMAFCMDVSRWVWKGRCSEVPLVIKRRDQEFRESEALNRALALPGVEVDDWRVMTHPGLVDKGARAFRRRIVRAFYDVYMFWVYRPHLVRSGFKQLQEHGDIYTTRLHACILSVLLGKERITFFENSYGKNSQFYATWLKDCDAVRLEV